MSTNFNPTLAHDTELELAIVALRAARPGEFAVLEDRLKKWGRAAFLSAFKLSGQHSDRSMGMAFAYDRIADVFADADGVIKDEKPKEKEEPSTWDE